MPFAKHETFYIREGWLFKGMSAIKAAEEEGQLPTIFLDADAPERLGIGQNMVRALRFWMQATGLAEERLEDRQRTQRLTPFGHQVWEYDRYLEDDATLWLIHYHLVCSEALATTWYWFFNHFAPVIFDEHNCLEALDQWVTSAHPDQRIAVNSLKKDLDCLLQTYIADKAPRTPEDTLESPFSRLQIMSRLGDEHRKHYRLERLDPSRLHPLILLYVLVDRQAQVRRGASQVGLGQILRESMNAGRIFNLTTAALSDLLAELNKHYPDWRIHFVRTAGLDQLTLPKCDPTDILTPYYTKRSSILEGNTCL